MLFSLSLPLFCPHCHSLHTLLFCSMLPPPPRYTLFPYTTLFRSPPLNRAAIDTPVTDPIVISTRLGGIVSVRSEEHTSELQSLTNIVCRLLLEKKKNDKSLAALFDGLSKDIGKLLGRTIIISKFC